LPKCGCKRTVSSAKHLCAYIRMTLGLSASCHSCVECPTFHLHFANSFCRLMRGCVLHIGSRGIPTACLTGAAPQICHSMEIRMSKTRITIATALCAILFSAPTWARHEHHHHHDEAGHHHDHDGDRGDRHDQAGGSGQSGSASKSGGGGNTGSGGNSGGGSSGGSTVSGNGSGV